MALTDLQRQRQTHGLLRHAHLHPAKSVLRSLVLRQGRWTDWRKGRGQEGPPRGTCRWCGCLTSNSGRWHWYCTDAYWAAVGEPLRVSQRSFPFGPCALCPVPKNQELPEGPEVELDHRVSIKVAQLTGPRHYIKAFDVLNLQWLCYQHHREKTQADRKRIRFLTSLRREVKHDVLQPLLLL